ncbi:DNA cytosine methyltransferase [Streptomyces sp. NPDC054842]
MPHPTDIRRAGPRPLVLDAFCCAGGMGMGFHLAGFDVVGVDIEPQPHYPFTFHQADAVTFIREHGHEFDLIHASPPCQDYSNLNAYNKKTYPRLIAPTRAAILTTGRPYVIENVESAANELIDPITLCGPMFGLTVYRHRVFETNWDLTPPNHPRHGPLCTRNGYLPTADRPYMTVTGGAHSRAWQNAAAEAMGMPWIKVPAGGNIKLGIREVCEAIPPAYAQYIGHAYLTNAAPQLEAAA